MPIFDDIRTYMVMTLAQLTLFAEDTPASLSLLPGSNEARQTTATSGRNIIDLYKKSNRVGSLAKMLLATSSWASTMCYLTWKEKVTPGNRLLFQLAPSTPRIEETGYGLWATPNTMDYLPQRSAEATIRHQEESRRNRTRPGNLREQVNPETMRLWPTVRASEYKDTGPVGSKSHQHMKNRNYLCAQVKEESQPTGMLNPTWVEWLMGYPTGWTELKR